MIIVDTKWENVKAMLTARSLAAQWVQVDSVYLVSAIDQDYALNCRIGINPVTPLDPVLDADQIDFESNFKAKGNLRLTAQLDSDNANFSRTKQAPTGWTYQLRGLEFKTSDVTSLVNLDPNGVQLADATIKLYDSTGAQTAIPAYAVKTVVDLEPPYDYYIIGGLAKIQTTPASDVRLSVIAVPDVPFAYGGSRIMIQNVNFKFITANDKIDADGRASKMLAYSATNHTSKLRFVIMHAAGDVNAIALYLEHYKI